MNTKYNNLLKKMSAVLAAVMCVLTVPSLNMTVGATTPEAYLQDFEGFDGGTEDGIFDEVSRACDTHMVVDQGYNKELLLERQLTTRNMDAILKKNLAEVYDGEYTVKFSLAQTVNRTKYVGLYNDEGVVFSKVRFGEGTEHSFDIGSSATVVEFENSHDGKYHHYTVSVNTAEKTIQLAYDDTVISSQNIAEDVNAKLGAIAFVIDDRVGSGDKNGMYIDNIQIYNDDAPLPMMPEFTVGRDGIATSITAEPDATIYYSTYNSFPTEQYTTPLTVETGCYLRAFAQNGNGARSSVAYIGPYPVAEAIRVRKSYLLDFEENRAGEINGAGCDGDGVKLFDNDFGMIHSKEIVDEGYNKGVLVARAIADNATGGWLQYTLEEDKRIDGGFVFEFSARQTEPGEKYIRLGNTAKKSFLNIYFGNQDSGRVGSKAVTLKNNLDGNYHHYKIEVDAENSVSFWYDGIQIIDEFTTTEDDSTLCQYRIVMAPKTNEINGAYIDNIKFYEISEPLPTNPKFKVLMDYTTEITADEGAQIYYSTDGSYPTELYTSPVAVADGGYLRAIAKDADNMRSAAVFNGPYPLEPFIEENRVIPEMSGKKYLLDFENTAVGNIDSGGKDASGNKIFDNNFGMIETKAIEEINFNKALLVRRAISDTVETGAWIQKTFDSDKIITGGFTVEFSAMQTEDGEKYLRLGNSTGSAFLRFTFGDKNTGKIGNTTIDLPNNLDGKFHSYKLSVNDEGSVSVWYDGNLVVSDYTIEGTYDELRQFRFAMGKKIGAANGAYIDNIAIYENSDPIPSYPQASVSSGLVEYGQTVSLSAAKDCVIYYTTDGSYPDFIDKYKYRKPIRIYGKDQYIKAIAVKITSIDEENDTRMGCYSACSVIGPFTPENENGVIRLTEDPFSRSSGNVNGAQLSLCNIDAEKNITLVLALYEGKKLVGISMEEYTLQTGVNKDLTISIEPKSNATVAKLFVRGEKDVDFSPMTDEWTIEN